MTSSVSFLDRLNNQQREAVLTDTRSVLVVAGPGTGKTHTLTTRLAYLLNRQDITPDSLLALTFTTRAAREMRERLRQLVGEAAQQVFIGTFHSLCVHLLRAEGHYLGLSPTFQVCDRHDQVTILQSVLRRLARRDSRAEAQRILHQFSRVRNLSVEVELELERAGLRDIYEAYRERLRKRGLLDFDELLLLGVYVLERQPALRQRWAGQFRFLSVDEYQDVNPVQLRLIRGLWEAGSHLWAVGDGDQAIYSFRGTQPQQFLNFENDFPGGLVRFLEKSYRFPPHIAIAASQVIARNSIRRSFSLATDKPAGSAIQVISFPDEQAEAAWIVRHIEEAIGGTSHYQHYKGKVHDVASQRARSFRDFAVLFRVQGIAKPLQDALTKSGIPYQFVGASRLFDRPMIKDLMAYLRVLIAPHDDVSLGHVLNRPPRGIGLQTQAALEAKAEDQEYSLFDILRQDNGFSPSQSGMIREFLQCLENLRSSMTAMPLSRFISHVAEVTGLKRWRTAQDPQHDRDVLLLRALAAKYDEHPPEQALQQFLVESALMEEADAYNSEIDAVTLATIHAVKGLEFTEVMLCGVEDEILPHINGDLEEERRLFYVGLTRAKEQVWLFHCRSRRVFGIRRACRVSRFLSEFDEALRTLTTVPDRSRRAKDTSQSDQLSLL